MKKFIFYVGFIFLFSFFLIGCGTDNSKDILKRLNSKFNNANSYYVNGVMEIFNNEDTYTYNVDVSYKKDNYYKVSLVNTLNNHEQVILRNDNGVYVVTPSLNKSFKFQSDWPYNNSQIYLLNSIIDDLSSDDKLLFKNDNKGYVFTSSVNYPNNKSLMKQNVYVDDKLNINKVEVTDKNNKVQISMKFDKVKLNKDFDKDYFELSNLIKINNNTDGKEKEKNDNNDEDEKTTKETATIKDVIYPMYLPSNTSLANKEIIDTDDGQRLILTFDGDNPFVLIEETVSYQKDGLVIPVNGDLDFLTDVIGVVSDNSLTWESNGTSYYLVSDTMETSELIDIAKSISVLPVSK